MIECVSVLVVVPSGVTGWTDDDTRTEAEQLAAFVAAKLASVARRS